MTLGEKLSIRRKAKSLTQDEVAEKLNVTPQAVSKWENDQSCPDIMFLPALADLYGTTVDELLSREDKPLTVLIPKEKRKSIDDMILLIRCEDGDNKIKVNLPLALLKIFLKSGTAPSIKMGDGMDLSSIDWQALITMIENGVVGRLIEMEGEDGETVIVEVQ